MPEQANIGLEGDFSMGHAGEEDARENVTAQGDGAQDDGSIGRHNEGGTPEGNTVQPSTLAFSSRQEVIRVIGKHSESVTISRWLC